MSVQLHHTVRGTASDDCTPRCSILHPHLPGKEAETALTIGSRQRGHSRDSTSTGPFDRAAGEDVARRGGHRGAAGELLRTSRRRLRLRKLAVHQLCLALGHVFVPLLLQHSFPDVLRKRVDCGSPFGALLRRGRGRRHATGAADRRVLIELGPGYVESFGAASRGGGSSLVGKRLPQSAFLKLEREHGRARGEHGLFRSRASDYVKENRVLAPPNPDTP